MYATCFDRYFDHPQACQPNSIYKEVHSIYKEVQYKSKELLFTFTISVVLKYHPKYDYYVESISPLSLLKFTY